MRDIGLDIRTGGELLSDSDRSPLVGPLHAELILRGARDLVGLLLILLKGRKQFRIETPALDLGIRPGLHGIELFDGQAPVVLKHQHHGLLKGECQRGAPSQVR